MSASPTCPKCAGAVRAPGLWSNWWQCERDGPVYPCTIVPTPSLRALEHLVTLAKVPVWIPRPMPIGWVVSGIGYAGDDRTGARATAVALSGPSPLGGPGDMIIVAEEPGVGLGARLAGLDGVDPGRLDGAPEAKVIAAGHPTALWPVPTPPDRAGVVGEAKALWLWAVMWPETTSLVLLERVTLHDLRDGLFGDVDLIFGAPSPYLAAAAPPAE